ncbi:MULTISPECIES: hypothetical protein [Staphylococcus]|nr:MULTISPECIES: hypothetical protein [Staphylococcus]
MDVNPAKALDELYNNEKFILAISKSDAVSDFFIGTMSFLENTKNIPKNLVNSISNSKAFVAWVSKLDLKMQDKILDGMIALSDKGYNLLNKSGEIAGWASRIASGKVGAIVRELGESKIIQGSKKGAEKLGAGKIGKAISSKAFAIGTVVLEGGVRSASAYFDKDSEAYHNVGKSVVSGTVDTIANVGPVDGALLGATIGAGIGFTAGLLIQGFKYYNPDIADDVKEIGYDFVDNVSKVGKSVKTEVNRMVSSAGKAFEKFSSKPLAVASGWFG